MDAVQDQQGYRSAGGSHYVRHRPEATLLYQVIDDYYPDFVAQLEAEGRILPRFVQREFGEYLKCGRLEHGFGHHRSSCRARRKNEGACERPVADAGRRWDGLGIPS